MDFGGDNMGYFPEDIPFMSEEELRYYGIRIPKDKPKDTSSNECVGIYISGLKMPQEGRITLQIDSNGGVYVVNKFSITSEKYEKSMIVTKISPHGRLGDLDALWDRMYKYSDNEGAKMPFGDNDFMIHRDSACELIEDAPTIIEAEE